MTHSNQPRSTGLKSTLGGLALCGGLGLMLANAASTEGGPQPAAPLVNNYIGAKKCKSCHSKDDVGDQYGKWAEGPHAKAFETLASEHALAVGKEHGVAEPQKDDACLKCHVTAFGIPEEQIARGFKADLGVQCESCHGPGEQHMKARFAAAAEAGAADKPVVIPADELAIPTQATCLECHNDGSPTFKNFCFHDRAAKIRHLRPGHTEEELAAMPVCGCGDTCDCVHGCEDGKCAVPAGEKK
jgi:hypothetical protein